MASQRGARPDRARQAHYILRERGTPPKGMLSNIIETSWQRCSSSGLSFEGKPNFDPLRRDSLSEQVEKNLELVSHATPILETLYEQIINIHNMVMLTDAHGLVLHSIGDADFLTRAQRVALMPGIDWSEEHKGTNAIGTALIEGIPVCVTGPEHFLQANHFLTCSAAPILDPMGKTIGVLDVSGDHRMYSRHTIALVKMSVYMIENHLFQSAFPEGYTLHFHSRPEFLGTLCEGIASFTQDGDFVSANRSACFQLCLDLDHLHLHSFSSLFGMRFQTALDQAALQPNTALSLCMPSGVRMYGLIKFGSKAPRPKRLFAFDSGPAGAKLVRSRQRQHVPRFGESLAGLMTGDVRLEAVCGKVKRVIGRDITILIQGETGTGKELLAQAIHNEGPRSRAPFVAVNCASVPDGLIESELFGYEEGAFTGAKRRGNVGKILQANGGTLFLDEVGDMPLGLQARLLRVLQERCVTPLGSVKSYPVDIAIICATNHKLREMVARGEFREDLYYRLNGLTVSLPPLRDRTDLRELVARILQSESPEGSQPRIAAEVMDLFLRHPWPGNVRQLTNLLRTALAMCDDAGVIRTDHLPDDFLDELQPAQITGEGEKVCQPEPDLVPANGELASLELQAIKQALEKYRGNVTAASRMLGISRNTIYRRLKDL